MADPAGQGTTEERMRWVAGVLHVCTLIELTVRTAIAKAEGENP